MQKLSKIEFETVETCPTCGASKKIRLLIGGKLSTIGCQCECDRSEEQRAEELRRIAHQEQQRRRRIARVFGRVDNLPSFDNRDSKTPENVLNAALGYVSAFHKMREAGNGLMLYGRPDQGKTWFAECLAMELLGRNRVEMIHAAEFINNLINQNASATIDCDLLVIDDFGSQRDTSFGNEVMFELVDNCYRNKIPMIITTNISPQEMMSNDDIDKHRIYARILERCLPIKVECGRQRVHVGNYDKMKRELGIL